MTISNRSLQLMREILPHYYTLTKLRSVFFALGLGSATDTSLSTKDAYLEACIDELRALDEEKRTQIAFAVADYISVEIERAFRSRQLDVRETAFYGSMHSDGWYPPRGVSVLGAQGRVTDRRELGEPERRGVPMHKLAAQDADGKRDVVFIVHGRNVALKESVARLVEKLGIEVVILHERESRGRMILEKFAGEASRVGFAIILLTADDEGALAGRPHNPRARQNVVFEFGYFVGKLGPQRVAALVEPDIELPSDVEGLVYVQVDSVASQSWRIEVAKEMRAAGLRIDLNKL